MHSRQSWHFVPWCKPGQVAVPISFHLSRSVIILQGISELATLARLTARKALCPSICPFCILQLLADALHSHWVIMQLFSHAYQVHDRRIPPPTTLVCDWLIAPQILLKQYLEENLETRTKLRAGLLIGWPTPHHHSCCGCAYIARELATAGQSLLPLEDLGALDDLLWTGDLHILRVLLHHELQEHSLIKERYIPARWLPLSEKYWRDAHAGYLSQTAGSGQDIGWVMPVRHPIFFYAQQSRQRALLVSEGLHLQPQW